MFDAGILLAAPSRSKSTLPVAASWTTPGEGAAAVGLEDRVQLAARSRRHGNGRGVAERPDSLGDGKSVPG